MTNFSIQNSAGFPQTGAPASMPNEAVANSSWRSVANATVLTLLGVGICSLASVEDPDAYENNIPRLMAASVAASLVRQAYDRFTQATQPAPASVSDSAQASSQALIPAAAPNIASDRVPEPDRAPQAIRNTDQNLNPPAAPQRAAPIGSQADHRRVDPQNVDEIVGNATPITTKDAGGWFAARAINWLISSRRNATEGNSFTSFAQLLIARFFDCFSAAETDLIARHLCVSEENVEDLLCRSGTSYWDM